MGNGDICGADSRSVDIVSPEINRFYALDQLFRLAGSFCSRYPSQFQILVETSHFNFPVFVT